MITDNKDNKISCEIIQDLMPSYIDGLTSESTTALIEEHIAECDDCRKMLENMRSDEGLTVTPSESEAKEIDFLKKNRKKGKRAVILGVILTLLVAAAAIGAKFYIIGSEYRGDMAFDVEVDGSNMKVGATAADSIHIIKGMDFTMNNGVVTGKAKAVLPGIIHSSGTFGTIADENGDAGLNMITCDWAGDVSFDEEIKEIRIGDRICWAGGRMISPKVSEVFKAGHNYIGSAPANGASLDALDITEDLGSLYSELETEKAPYIWTIVLDEDQTKYRDEYLGKRLEAYAYVLLGTVGNLSEVDFRYTADNKTVVKKITVEDADKFFGKDIKACRTDAGLLSELMGMTDID